ncbi:AAA family ATPase [Frankia sp. Mgl5]|uniref:3'-5' exonuclease n=1 Tax=Frankia sp. Mgl5 TaxID=2933793 RepID=UPI00200F1EE0|nr:3'-5' exonuclease [Frankia sp. Mgl5]MCK9926962.1 AAA family ATPase [Frankia sp. Mgl5]
MSNITMSRQFRRRLDIDGSLKQRAWDFLTKLMADPASPGLHIEPIRNSADPRVRTGRVNDNFRAVMFLVAETPEPHFVLAAVAKHDEANALAQRLVLTTNPVSGVLEVIENAEPVVLPGPRPVHGHGTAGWVPQGPLAGFTPRELEDLGLSATLARRAVTCPDEDALVAAAGDERVPPWQADALLALATGTPIHEIHEQLGLADPETEQAPARPDQADQTRIGVGIGAGVPTRPASDADVAAALRRPSTLMDFVRIETDSELRRVLDGSFAEWRVFLHPEQRRYAYVRTSGAYRLSGGAGTGKTVVALHRARSLATAPAAPRVVLTTFTRNLADNLAQDLRTLDASVWQGRLGQAGVTVRGIDQLALDVLGTVPADIRAVTGGDLLSAGAVPRPLSDTDERTMWTDAARAAGLTGDLARPAFLRGEYRMVVLANDLTTRAQYLRVPRPGRGTRLSRAQRMAIWDAVEAYRRQLALGQTASYAEIAVLAARCADAFAAAGGPRPADHVVVDEAQDLHPGHWRLLRALVAEGPDDLFLAEDSHQRIYGEKVVLSRYGIQVRGRSRRLTLNYRTTAQNLRFAVGILAGDTDVTDLEGDAEATTGYRSAMSGPAPVLRACSGLTEELDVTAETLRGWFGPPSGPNGNGSSSAVGTGTGTGAGTGSDDAQGRVEAGSVGVLTRSARERDIVAQGLRDRGIAAQVIAGHALPGHAGGRDTHRSDAPRLMTMHRAKGLEFSRVVLFGIDRKSVPSERVLATEPDDERDDTLARERFLLYVAASRARDALVVVWAGDASPFLPVSPSGG